MGAVFLNTPFDEGPFNVGWYSDVDNRYLGAENPFATGGFNNKDAAFAALRLAGGNGRPEGMGHDWNNPQSAMSSVLDAYSKNPNYAKAGITREMLTPWVNEQSQGWQKELSNRQNAIGEEGGLWGGLSKFMNSPAAVLALGGGLLGAGGAFSGFGGLEGLDPSWADSFGDIGGLPGGTQGGGMWDWLNNVPNDLGYDWTPPNVNSPLMPPAVPESPETLKAWGLQETAPGVWSHPAQPDIQMGIRDWLRLGSSALGGGGGGTNGENMLGGLFGGSNGSLLGTGLGALLGSMNGTKKIDDAVTTQTNYNPTLSPLAEGQLAATMRGDYLSPDSNPWLKQAFDRGAGEIQNRLSPSFGHMEAFGNNSGWQNAYGRSLADLGTGLYGGNYQQERGRQFSAANAASPYAKSTSTPVYSNPLGGMFSGALAGNVLGGKLFG